MKELAAHAAPEKVGNQRLPQIGGVPRQLWELTRFAVVEDSRINDLNYEQFVYRTARSVDRFH